MLQSVDPTEENVPAAQRPVERERPDEAQYEPDGQAVHDEADSNENLPDAQAPVTAINLTEAQYDPEGQDVQLI